VGPRPAPRHRSSDAQRARAPRVRAHRRARDTAEWGTLKTSRHIARPQRRAAVHREHEAIVKALRERDSRKARQAMLDHLLRVRHNLLG